MQKQRVVQRYARGVDHDVITHKGFAPVRLTDETPLLSINHQEVPLSTELVAYEGINQERKVTMGTIGSGADYEILRISPTNSLIKKKVLGDKIVTIVPVDFFDVETVVVLG